MANPAGAGWYGLLSILQANEEERRYFRERVPVACPRDGEPLTAGPEGEWFCRFDGWTWDGSIEDAQPRS
jgi:hypothetical protein